MGLYGSLSVPMVLCILPSMGLHVYGSLWVSMGLIWSLNRSLWVSMNVYGSMVSMISMGL